MRTLVLLLVVASSTPGLAQELAPRAFRVPAARGPNAVTSLSSIRSDTTLSLGRHILVGVAVGVLATGAGFLIEGAVNDDAYDDCIMCPIVVPVVIAGGGVAGGIGGAIVFGLRRLSQSDLAPRAPR